MYFNISTDSGRTFTIHSTSADLTAFKAELASETVGYLTQDGAQLIMINIIRSSVITIAPIRSQGGPNPNPTIP
jgi:hypothetical protein